MPNVLHIYTRVSTAAQEEDGTSIETQTQHGIERAEKLGMEYKIWNEGAQSSSKDSLINRPVLAELLAQIETGDVEHLYVWNTDRLSRNLETWGAIRFKLIKNDITLHTPTGKQILSDPQTNLLIGILSEISEYDNQLRMERFRLGKLQKIKSGGWKGGPPPFGYRLENKRLIPDDYEQEWVKFIFENFRDGKSVDEIRTLLMSNGVQTRRGNPVWSHGSINSLLNNTHYNGYYKFTDKKSGETVRVECPAILTSTLIDSVRNEQKKRGYGQQGSKRTKTSNQKYIYLLSDLLECGHCGAKYGGNYKKTQTSYYSCLQKTHKFKTKFTDKHIVCGSNRNIRIDKTDEVVWEAVVNVLAESSLFKETIKLEMLNGKTYRQSTAGVKKLKSKLSRLDKEIQKITDSIINSEADRLINRRTPEESKAIIKKLEDHRIKLERDKELLKSELGDEEDNRKWVDWVKLFGQKINNLKDFSLEDKKQFLSGVVEKISVTNTDVREHLLDIEFRLPYVGDQIQWKNPREKSKGYTLIDGKKTMKLKGNLLKKSTR